MSEPSDSGAPLRIRPIDAADAAAFATLHGRTDAAAVAALVAESRQAGAADGPGPLRQVFLLTRRQAGGERLLGAAALTGSVGLDLPRYTLRCGTVVHASAELKLFHRAATLLLGNDLTGCAELGLPLMASADAAEAPLALLVDAMLLFVAERPDLYAGTVIAALPGIRYEGGGSPLWSGLGRHFHAGPVPDADAFFGSAERSHIGRLFPKHPLYSSFLGSDAQACIGQRAIHARAADAALRAQGFRAHGHVDIFDGGPVLSAELADLAALRRSRRQVLRVAAGADAEASEPCLLLSPRIGIAAPVQAHIDGDAVLLSAPVAGALRLEAGERVRVLRRA